MGRKERKVLGEKAKRSKRGRGKRRKGRSERRRKRKVSGEIKEKGGDKENTEANEDEGKKEAEMKSRTRETGGREERRRVR